MAQYEVTLRDCWRILRRRRGGVIFTAFLLGFFSFVLAQIWQPIPEYTAEAKIQIEANQSMDSLYLESFGYSVGDEIETKSRSSAVIPCSAAPPWRCASWRARRRWPTPR